MAARCEIVVTRQGQRAMLDRDAGEVMHPGVGPLAEAERLYLAPSRLAARLTTEPCRRPLVLFDVGLGAGSNAAAAWRLSEGLPSTARQLEIVSFERALDAFRLALAPEHRAAFGLEGPAADAGLRLLERGECETPRTRWRLSLGDLRERLPREPPGTADVIFWDPFSPAANPELWSVAVFRSLRAACRSGATLHTYSTATRVRSALLLAGFCVGHGVSIGDKAETTVAALTPAELERPLGARWLARLARSSAGLPADAPPDALARIRALPQFA
jgi:queuine tRNA-ribosyltransferase